MSALKSLLPRLADIKAQAEKAWPASSHTDVPAMVEALEEAKALLERASTFDCGHEDAEMCRCPLAKTLSAIREALGQ